MKNVRTLLCLSAAVMALGLIGAAAHQELASQSLPTSLVFAPEPGARLKKSFERRVTLARSAQTLVVGGSETQQLEGIYEVDETLRIELEDHYLKTSSGVPTRLERHYETATSSYEERQSDDLQPGLQRIAFKAESDLTGRTVLFERSPTSGATVASFAPNSIGSPPELLSDLVLDTDLTGLLPIAPVAPGATWSVPPSWLREVLSPGGDLHLEARADELPRGLATGAGTDFSSWIGNLEGTVNASLEGLETTAGRDLARIRIEFSVAATEDQTERARELSQQLAGDWATDESVAFDFLEISLALEGQGELLWDLAAGLPHAFELEAALGIVIESGLTVSVEDVRLEVEESSELTGSVGLRLTSTLR